VLKKKGGITLRFKLAPITEKRLREYVKQAFRCSLEDKLNEVIVIWIGKALEQIRETIHV